MKELHKRAYQNWIPHKYFSVTFLLETFLPQNTSNAALNKRKHRCNKKTIIYDKSVSLLIRNLEVVGVLNTLTLSTYVFTVFHQIVGEWKYYC